MGDRLRRAWASEGVGRDLLLAAGLVLLSVTMLREAARLPPPFFDPLGSAAVPRLAAVTLIVLSLAIVVRHVLAPRARDSDKEDEDFAPRSLVAVGSVLITIAYAGVMQLGWLGFREATVLMVLALGGILSLGDRRKLLLLVPLALVAGFGLNFIFTRVFFVDVPQIDWF